MKSMKSTALAGSLAIAACLLAPPVAAQTTGTGATETGSTGATQNNTTTSGTNRNDTTSGAMGSVNGTQSTTTGTSSTDVNRSTTGTAASDVNRTTGTTSDTDRELPRTASSFPLVAAIGILSLAAAITLRRVSGRHAV